MQPSTILQFLTCFTSGLYFYCWSRLLTPSNELLSIISIDLYTNSKTFFDATEHNLTVSHVLYLSNLFLVLNTCCQEWSRIITLCKELLFKVGFYTVYISCFDVTEHSHSVSHFRYIWTLFSQFNTFSDEWSPIMTLCNELHYKVGFYLHTVYMTRFDATYPNLTVSYDR
jgi:hypothetical protein